MCAAVCLFCLYIHLIKQRLKINVYMLPIGSDFWSSVFPFLLS